MYLSILLLIIHKILLGYSFDNEPIILLDNDTFSNHYLIHEIFKYFSCFIVALISTIKEKIDQKKDLAEKNVKDEKNLSKHSFTLISHFTIIYRETIEKNKIINSKMLIFSTFFLNIVLEQMIIIFRKFFVPMDFWMIELFIVAFLNKKIYKIQIYKHQKMAFIFIFISIFFNLLTVILTISEKNEEKALYVGNIYSIIIAYFIFCYYAFFYPFLL